MKPTKDEGKADELRAIVAEIEGKRVVLELVEGELVDYAAIKRRLYKGRNFAYLTFYDPDRITDLQRKHYFALVGDIVTYTGYCLEDVDSALRSSFQEKHDLGDYLSLSRHSGIGKDLASKLLEEVIVFCIDHDIPFRKQKWYLTTDVSKMLFALTMKRLCWICGKPGSDIAHVEAVGSGRDRRKIDHTKHTFMCLCRRHHNEQHQIGIRSFEKKYHVKGIKLKQEHLKELGVM